MCRLLSAGLKRREQARKEAAMLDVAEWTNNKSQGSLMSVCPYVFCHIVFRGDHYLAQGSILMGIFQMYSVMHTRDTSRRLILLQSVKSNLLNLSGYALC